MQARDECMSLRVSRHAHIIISSSFASLTLSLSLSTFFLLLLINISVLNYMGWDEFNRPTKPHLFSFFSNQLGHFYNGLEYWWLRHLEIQNLQSMWLMWKQRLICFSLPVVLKLSVWSYLSWFILYHISSKSPEPKPFHDFGIKLSMTTSMASSSLSPATQVHSWSFKIETKFQSCFMGSWDSFFFLIVWTIGSVFLVLWMIW